MEEILKPIENFDGYFISNLGNVYIPLPPRREQKLISDFLDNKSVKRYNKITKSIAQQSSERELNAFYAEREADDMKKAEYMSYHIGEEFDAIISSVTGFGFFAAMIISVASSPTFLRILSIPLSNK